MGTLARVRAASTGETLRLSSPLGRRVLPVRICTCPGRDKEHDERQAGVTGGKKRKLELSDGDASGSYWVLATDRDNYEALCAVGRGLEKQKSGNVAAWEQKVKKMNSAVKGEKECALVPRT